MDDIIEIQSSSDNLLKLLQCRNMLESNQRLRIDYIIDMELEMMLIETTKVYNSVLEYNKPKESKLAVVKPIKPNKD